MATSTEPQIRTSACDQAAIIYKKIKKISAASNQSSTPKRCHIHLPRPSRHRKAQSLQEQPFHLDNGTPRLLGGGPDPPDTVLYLAYGSNLCAQTFQGNRGIRPLSQVNVVVPELVMTFDLAGLPYVEPCFANTKYRRTSSPPPIPSTSEKSHLLPTRMPRYHKNRWKKGLVGVVYEVTRADYAHILATEGGGASYQDILADCHELPPYETTVPESPTSRPFKAHTLYSPVLPPDQTLEKGGRFSRPDPDYAQASARYLKLITDGADEHALPGEYKDYLHQLRSYTMTTRKQKFGGWVFSMIWLPLISAVFALNSVFGNDRGQAPAWLVAITGAIFRAMWTSYDGVFVRLFGDGERTHYEEEEDKEAAWPGPWTKYDGVAEKRSSGYEEV